MTRLTRPRMAVLAASLVGLVVGCASERDVVATTPTSTRTSTPVPVDSSETLAAPRETEPTSGPTTDPEPTRQSDGSEPDAAAAGIAPQYRGEYDFAYIECRYNIEQLYAESGSDDTGEIVAFVAAGMRPGWHEASRQGCMDGLRDGGHL